MTLHLHELHAFRVITEHGSVGRVAEAIGLTQPALTPRRCWRAGHHRLPAEQVDDDLA